MVIFLENDRNIPPIEAIERTLRVKPIGRIRLFKRPEYMPKKQSKNNHSHKEKELEQNEKGNIKNHASHAPGMIGVSIDYKA